MSRRTTMNRMLAAAMLLAASSSTGAVAQNKPQQNAPNALQGFSQNKDKPVEIEATSLEVRDKAGIATFSGNVKVVQGDTTMRCKLLVVHYVQSQNKGKDPTPEPAAKAAQPGAGGSQQISRLEATGGVIVTQKDQTATGDRAVFEMRSNTVTLFGNVVISQGKSVMKGEQLVVDLTTGAARVESGKQGPVRMIIQQQPNPSGQGGSTPGGQKPALMRPFSSN